MRLTRLLKRIKLKQGFCGDLQGENNFFQIIKAWAVDTAFNIADGFNTHTHLFGQFFLGNFPGLAQLLYAFTKLLFELHKAPLSLWKGGYLIEVELRL